MAPSLEVEAEDGLVVVGEPDEQAVMRTRVSNTRIIAMDRFFMEPPFPALSISTLYLGHTADDEENVKAGLKEQSEACTFISLFSATVPAYPCWSSGRRQ